MKKTLNLIAILMFSFGCINGYAQKPTVADSLHVDSLRKVTERMLLQQEKQRGLDSLIKLQLQKEISLAVGDQAKTKELADKLKQIAANDSIRKAESLQKIEILKKNALGYAVAPFNDTLFYVYTKIGSFSAKDRASAISQRIAKLYSDPFFSKDSLAMIQSENGYDILYNKESIILSVTEMDALWYGKDTKSLTEDYLGKIREAIETQKKSNSLVNWLLRFAMVALIILGLVGIVWLINRLFRKLSLFLANNRKKYFSGFSIRKVKIFSAEQLWQVVIKAQYVLKILVIILSVYLSLPLLFSVFPETKNWTNTLLNWVLTPARSAFSGIFHFLPNVFTILVIYFLFRYAIKGVKFFVDEIEKGTLQLAGFHADWAQPTFNILRFLLYAFMVVLIWPYLPGSGSTAFQGVSVFVGVLFSLGSSSAISNMIAGLVITYMRPFKIGDRVKIGDIVGDVMEKTALVTRIRTIKNEDITVPNSTVLSSNTINYSTNTRPDQNGLIMHTTVTIGYDVPWKKMHQALIDAALKTDMLEKEPMPFVLQTSLDDFYVSYQLNAYTREANKQAGIYSQLHQHIQDCCNEAGIEILSPHYRAMRDGNMVTIPADYLDKDYQQPSFSVSYTEKKDPSEKNNMG